MSQLMIKDLSITEELSHQAMAGVSGGHGHPPYGKAWGHRGKGCYEPMRKHQPEYISLGDVRTAQAGVGIFNFNDVDFGGGSISITTNGGVTATASA